MMPITTSRTIRHTLLALLFIASCTAALPLRAAEPLPEFYGFYALDNGELHELRESSKIEANFSPHVRFILFDKSAALMIARAHLSRLKFVRNARVPADPNNSMSTATVVKAKRVWRSSDEQGRYVELRAKPVAGQSEMIMLVPREPLRPGTYEARPNAGNRLASFFVDRDSVFENLESSDDCVDEEFEAGGWTAFGQQLSGRGVEVPCSQSTMQEGASGQSQPGAGGLFPQTEEEARLSALMTELMQRPLTTPAVADTPYPGKRCGATFSYPADWEFMPERKGPVLATVAAPASDKPLEARTQITVTCQQGAPTLTSLVNNTMVGVRQTIARSTIAGPVKTKLAGVDAYVFVVTGVESGRVRQKAVTVAVYGEKALGLVLHATPEMFDRAWDEYQRVAASYTVH